MTDNLTRRKLSEARAADRIEMARGVRRLAKRYAPKRVITTIEMDPHGNEKAVQIEIKGPGGLTVDVCFDGNSPQIKKNTFVLAWHIAGEREWIIAPGFAPDINEFHHRKVTEVFYSYESMLRGLRCRFQDMEDGTAVRRREEA